MSRVAVPRTGLTAIEVLASTILASLLMAALIGVLRGLKAHERTLDARQAGPPWHAALDAALEADLKNAERYTATPTSLALYGHGDRNEQGDATWLPSAVVYEIRPGPQTSWLVRRELPTGGGPPPRPDNLVLAGAASLRIGEAGPAFPAPSESSSPATVIASPKLGLEQPLGDALTIDILPPGDQRPLYHYAFRRL